ncbi:hypothetical protein MRB56_21785 [Halomonas cupida]|uniref:hypothetical protein n=1 Tax=Halomonas cupida TaxID=44933 RepID=UPI0039B3D128
MDLQPQQLSPIHDQPGDLGRVDLLRTAAALQSFASAVVINQVMGLSTHGRCLVSNMSAEGVHIETVQVWLHDRDGVRRCTVSDLETDVNGNRPTSLSEGTLQGPLSSNAHIDAGGDWRPGRAGQKIRDRERQEHSL